MEGPTRYKRRKQLSCDPCRLLRLKCSQAEGICSRCRSNGLTSLECTRTLVPTRDNARASSSRSASRQQHEEIEPVWDAGQSSSVPQPLASSILKEDLVARLTAALPSQAAQIENVINVYATHIGAAKVVFDTGKLQRLTRQLYLNSESNIRGGQSLALFSWLCAITSAVYDLLPSTLLVIWGIVEEAEQIERKASTLSALAIESFHAARHDYEDSNGKNLDSSQVLMILQAGFANLSTASARIPSIPWCAILDACIRLSRRNGLHRLGICSGRGISFDNEQVEKAAIWSGLVYCDWIGATYHGSYSIFAGTFDTQWDYSMEGEEDSIEETEWASDVRRMYIWPQKVRIASINRQLYDMGTHDAVKRHLLSYDDVLYLDKAISDQIESRPNLWKIESYCHTDTDHVWKLVQAYEISHALWASMLYLHMPYIIQGCANTLQSASVPSSAAYSMERALESASCLVEASRRLASSGSLIHTSILMRHSLFNAGLVLMLSLVLSSTDQGASSRAADQLAYIIELLDQICRQKQRRGDHLDVSSKPSSSTMNGDDRLPPYGLDLAGVRLEKLLTKVMKFGKQANGSLDGRLAVDKYMQAYSTDLDGHVYRGGKSHEDSSKASAQQFSQSHAATTVEDNAAMTSEQILRELLVFAETPTDLGLSSLLSDPFALSSL